MRTFHVYIGDRLRREDLTIGQRLTQGDLIVGGRLTKGDLIVVNLTAREYLDAYSGVVLDTQPIHLIAEKAMMLNGHAVVFAADVGCTADKYFAANSGLSIGASAAACIAIYPSVASCDFNLSQSILESVQKNERASVTLLVGVEEAMDITPLKGVGRVEDGVVLEAVAGTVKYAFVNEDIRLCTAPVCGVEEMTMVCCESAEDQILLGADVKSLGFLRYLPMAEGQLTIGSDMIDIEQYWSLGRCLSDMEIGFDAQFSADVFMDAVHGVVIGQAVKLAAEKRLHTAAGLTLFCQGAAILRRKRTLDETDAIGTLDMADNMTLDDLDYIDL